MMVSCACTLIIVRNDMISACKVCANIAGAQCLLSIFFQNYQCSSIFHRHEHQAATQCFKQHTGAAFQDKVPSHPCIDCSLTVLCGVLQLVRIFIGVNALAEWYLPIGESDISPLWEFLAAAKSGGQSHVEQEASKPPASSKASVWTSTVPEQNSETPRSTATHAAPTADGTAERAAGFVVHLPAATTAGRIADFVVHTPAGTTARPITQATSGFVEAFPTAPPPTTTTIIAPTPSPTPAIEQRKPVVPKSAASEDDWVKFGLFDHFTARDPIPDWAMLPQDPITPTAQAAAGFASPFSFVVVPAGPTSGPMALVTSGPAKGMLLPLVYMPPAPTAQIADGFAGETAFPPSSTPIPSPAPAAPHRKWPGVPSAMRKNHMALLMFMELNKRYDPRPVVTDSRPEPMTSYDHIPSYPSLNPPPTFRQRQVGKIRQAPRRLQAWLRGLRQPTGETALHRQMALLASEEEQALCKGLLYRECEYPCNCIRCFRASGGNVAPAA